MGTLDDTLAAAVQRARGFRPVTHRVRRGQLVEIPEEWRGQVTHRQTIMKRPSNRTRKARNAEPRTYKQRISNRRAHIEGRAPTLRDEE